MKKNFSPVNYSDALWTAHSYKFGINRDVDFAMARRLYRMCARSGDRKIASIAQYNLGIFYYYGFGVEKNQKKAFELFMKSVILYPNKDAYLILGDMYRYGQYVEADDKIAVGLYARAAK